MHAETIQWVGIQVGIWFVLSHSPNKTASVTLLFKMGRKEVARIICIRNLHVFFSSSLSSLVAYGKTCFSNL